MFPTTVVSATPLNRYKLFALADRPSISPPKLMAWPDPLLPFELKLTSVPLITTLPTKF